MEETLCQNSANTQPCLVGFDLPERPHHRARMVLSEEDRKKKSREKGRRHRKSLTPEKWEIRRASHREWNKKKLKNDPAFREANRQRLKRWREKYPERHRAAVRKWQLENPEKVVANSRRWQLKHPEFHRNEYLVYNYGISLEIYDSILKKQDGVCSICKRPERAIFKGKVKRLTVDHCHNSKKVRGLLCHSCNVSLGLLKENPETMRAMADYIESHQGGTLTNPNVTNKLRT